MHGTEIAWRVETDDSQHIEKLGIILYNYIILGIILKSNACTLALITKAKAYPV